MDRVTNKRQIIIEGREVNFQVAFKQNRKRISIFISERGEIQVRCPPGVPLKQVDALLVREKTWLGNRLSDIHTKNRGQQSLGEGVALPFLGDWLTLRLATWGRGTVFRCGDDLWITRVDGDAIDVNLDIRRPLERWYVRGAGIYFPQRLDHWSKKMGVSFAGFNVRSQKTRWGSCSSRGTINLNWRLLWAPPRVVDYVVVHELCHRDHMDHSPAFWAAVRRFIPDYRVCRECLKTMVSPW